MRPCSRLLFAGRTDVSFWIVRTDRALKQMKIWQGHNALWCFRQHWEWMNRRGWQSEAARKRGDVWHSKHRNNIVVPHGHRRIFNRGSDTWLETVGGAEKEGADISPKKEKKIFQLSNRLLAAAQEQHDFLEKTGDFYFTFSLACVPPQGTLLLAHKEAAQFLAAGRSLFPAALALTLSTETTFKDWKEKKRWWMKNYLGNQDIWNASNDVINPISV